MFDDFKTCVKKLKKDACEKVHAGFYDLAQLTQIATLIAQSKNLKMIKFWRTNDASKYLVLLDAIRSSMIIRLEFSDWDDSSVEILKAALENQAKNLELQVCGDLINLEISRLPNIHKISSLHFSRPSSSAIPVNLYINAVQLFANTRNITNFSLSLFSINDMSAQLISDALLASTTCSSIEYSNCYMSEDSWKYFFKAIRRNPNIQVLELAHCNLTLDLLKFLRVALTWSCLKKLTIYTSKQLVGSVSAIEQDVSRGRGVMLNCWRQFCLVNNNPNKKLEKINAKLSLDVMQKIGGFLDIKPRQKLQVYAWTPPESSYEPYTLGTFM